MRYDKKTNIATARGYTGNGVATANLAGRVVTDLILGVDSAITHLPPANHTSRNWEPEPFRFSAPASYSAPTTASTALPNTPAFPPPAIR